MHNKYFLVIDRGQSSIKAALCDTQANILEMESCQCPPISSPHTGWAEQDMMTIWNLTLTAVRQLIKKNTGLPEQIAAISFSGQGGGNFLISENGLPIYPGVLSLDSRHAEINAQISGPLEVPRTVSFMRWLKEKEPDVFADARWILGSKDWIRFQLTGKVNADMSDPPAPVDETSRQYMTDVLKQAGIPECAKMLPPLKYAGEICGYVTEKAAGETGLLPGTPVVTGAHDMIACSVGAGGIRPGHLTIILGTLGINIATVDRNISFAPEEPGKAFTFHGIVPGARLMTTSAGSYCNTVNWFIDTLFEKEKKNAIADGTDLFRYIEKKLAGKAPTSILFQPYLRGTFYNDAAKAGIIGITASSTPEDILLSIFQGVCLSMCMEISYLESIQPCSDIWIVGGGSKSRIWGQMFADILMRPVKVCSTSEVACRGAALCAGTALGLYRFGEADFPLPDAALTWYPRKSFNHIYQQQLELYKKAYHDVSEIWRHQ